MDFSKDKPKKRILGSMLPEYVGHSVCLLGTFVQMDSNGRTLKMKSSDNQDISVQLQQPPKDSFESIIEVQGTVSSDNMIQCVRCIPFKEDMVANFDMAMYNEAVEILARYPDHYVTIA